MESNKIICKRAVIKYRTGGGGGDFVKNHGIKISNTPTEITTKISCVNKINCRSPKTIKIMYLVSSNSVSIATR